MAERATDDEPIRMGGFSISINPGSGNVIDATEAAAIDCMDHFLTDVAIERDERYGDVRWLREPSEDERGRFGFLVYRGNRCAVVQMPGLALHRVRFVHAADQDVWQFPRLYVDGSSWIWCIATGIVAKQLTGAYDEDGE